MPTRTARRLSGVLAAPALGLALVACGIEDQAASQTSAHEVVLASVEGLDDTSYKIESTMTLNGLDYITSAGTFDGENAQVTYDLDSVALAAAEDLTPEEIEMANAMFEDIHTETIVVDKVVYMQMSGDIFDAMAEEFGEDAWFAKDLTEEETLSDVASEYGGMALTEQTDLILADLVNVQETGDGAYTGLLTAQSEAMSTLSGYFGDDISARADGTQVAMTLDDDGLLKTMAVTLPEFEGLTMAITSEIVEVGGDYVIEAPATDNLHDFEEFSTGAGDS